MIHLGSITDINGAEIEPVDVFPVIETGVDFIGVLVERFGLEPLLHGRTRCVLREELIFVHDTDFF